MNTGGYRGKNSGFSLNKLGQRNREWVGSNSLRRKLSCIEYRG